MPQAKYCGKFLIFYCLSCPTLLHSLVCPRDIRVREAPVRVCVLTLAGARWAVPRWSPAPLDGRGCGCWAPCSRGWRESAAGWTRPPSAGLRSLQSEGGQRRRARNMEITRKHTNGAFLCQFNWKYLSGFSKSLEWMKDYNPRLTEKENLSVKETSTRVQRVTVKVTQKFAKKTSHIRTEGAPHNARSC